MHSSWKLFCLIIGFLLLSKEFVDCDRSMCPDCVDFPNGITSKLNYIGIRHRRHAYVFTTDWKRIYIPKDIFPLAMQAVIHDHFFYANTRNGDYFIKSKRLTG